MNGLQLKKKKKTLKTTTAPALGPLLLTILAILTQVGQFGGFEILEIYLEETFFFLSLPFPRFTVYISI